MDPFTQHEQLFISPEFALHCPQSQKIVLHIFVLFGQQYEIIRHSKGIKLLQLLLHDRSKDGAS